MGQKALLQDTAALEYSDASELSSVEDESADEAEESTFAKWKATKETGQDLLGEPLIGKRVIRGIRSG